MTAGLPFRDANAMPPGDVPACRLRRRL